MTMWKGPRWDKQHHVVHVPISKSVLRTFKYGNNYLLYRSVLLATGHALMDANLSFGGIIHFHLYENNDRFVINSVHVHL